MKCDLVCHLIDDYLGNQLSQRDCQRLEKHVADCPHCTEELRDRLAFERSVRQALAASVQHLQLAPDASRGIVQAVDSGLQQTVWSYDAMRVVRMVAGVAVVALLLVGLSFYWGRIPTPLEVQQVIRPPVSRPALAVNRNHISIDPPSMQPGEMFTVTVPIQSDHLPSFRAIRCDLDITGPTGDFHFVLVLQGPLPVRGVSVLQVTPDVLAAACQDQYQMSPADIFGAPGVYTLRITLFSPVVPPVQ
jgi:hypothetical protein